FDDNHAARVLPGFLPDSKIRMLTAIRDRAEILFAISAEDIEKNKVRADTDTGYGDETLRLAAEFRRMGFTVSGAAITKYAGQPGIDNLRRRLDEVNIPTYLHYPIEGYPTNIPHIVSDEGYGRCEYFPASKPIVIVTAPGPGSGKMAVCLSQLYHEHKRGMKAGYSKFETFPVWNLPLRHPVNLAYEAATADLRDVNMIDPFHMDKYGIYAVNYNRDVEAFPLLSAIYQKISGECPYNSPTDMGVNMAGFCITDNDVVETAARNEIIRRYFTALADRAKRPGDPAIADIVYKLELIMQQAEVSTSDRAVASKAREKAEATGGPAAAIEIDGEIITGKTTPILGASSAAMLNALKHLADVPDEVHLLSPAVLEPVMKLKVNQFGSKNPRLHTDELLIVLSVCAVTDDVAKRALECVPMLKGCEAHLTVTPAHVDKSTFKKLGMNFTYDAVKESRQK
ncbi:MAG: DUF1846 domain-containing protein, partial [Clostridia bacterium]|nr:DUF1846 domain-containing protein [Clostridia bacterium]